MVQKGLRLLFFFAELGVPLLTGKICKVVFFGFPNYSRRKIHDILDFERSGNTSKRLFLNDSVKKKAALNWDEAAGGNWAGKGLLGWRPLTAPPTSPHLSQIQFRTIPSSCVHKRPAECTRLFNQLLPEWNVDCLCDAQQCKGCWLSDVSE